MPRALIVDVWQKQDTKYEVSLNRFMVNFGHKDRDSIQIRLEDDGTVMLFDDREGRSFGKDKILTVKIPFALLAEEWPRFLMYLRSMAVEKEKENES